MKSDSGERGRKKYEVTKKKGEMQTEGKREKLREGKGEEEQKDTGKEKM